MDKEIWKDIEGYKGLYQISNMGKVKSVGRISKHTNRNIPTSITRGIMHKNGYMFVKLFNDEGKRKQMAVHRLVAMHFLPIIEGKLHVNHINGIKQDNRVDNLEWVTPHENSMHASMTGLTHSICIKCVQTGQVFTGIRAAARELGIHSASISKALSGKLKSIHGLNFIKVDNSLLAGTCPASPRTAKTLSDSWKTTNN